MTSAWCGTLVDRGMEMRLVLHIGEGADGLLEGTLDNLDLGRMGMAVDGITLDQGALRFSVDDIGARFEGRMSRDGRKARGDWRMDDDAALPLELHRVTPSALEGIWAGTLSFQSMRLRLEFYLAGGRDGVIGAMKSIDQNGAMVPLSWTRLAGSAVLLEARGINACFTGTIDADGSEIAGTWTQNQVEIPLSLQRTAVQEEPPARPQEPEPPFPYREEEVRYRNHRANCELAATLTIPEGGGPFPAVLLISGSGEHDRDGSMAGHRPFLVLADFLTRRGVAVLRSDDRGVGESGGEFHQSTTSDFATDAEAAVDFLRGRTGIDARRIGLIGHSEGALIAAMVAARDQGIAFIIMLAGPGLPGWVLAGQQARRQAELSGSNAQEAGRLNEDLVAILRSETDLPKLRRKLDQRLAHLPESQRAPVVDYCCHPWQRHFVTLTPADFLRRVTCPVLALTGEKDVLVEPKSNLAAIREAVEAGGNRNFEVAEMAGLNHLFQTCDTGSATEYGQIEETLSPVLLDKVAQWIAARGRYAPGEFFNAQAE